jgi:hypothetical protein
MGSRPAGCALSQERSLRAREACCWAAVSLEDPHESLGATAGL